MEFQWLKGGQQSFTASDKGGLRSRRLAGSLAVGICDLLLGQGMCVTAGVELESAVARGASGASPEETGSLTRAAGGQSARGDSKLAICSQETTSRSTLCESPFLMWGREWITFLTLSQYCANTNKKSACDCLKHYKKHTRTCWGGEALRRASMKTA